MPSGISKTLSAFHAELVAAGLARQPNVAGAAPPMYVEPADGPPEPGTRTGLEADADNVTAIRYGGGIPPARGQHWQRLVMVDMWIRTKGHTTVAGSRPAGPASARAFDFEQAVRDRLFPNSEPIRTSFTLGAGAATVYVLEALVQRDLAEVESGAQGYTYIATYAFQIYD